MSSNKRITACAIALVLCSHWSTASAQRIAPAPVCRSKFEVGCAPQRVTYGHYKTTWRRWPTDDTAAAKPGAEQVPTPAKEPDKEPLPKVEPDESKATPEETIVPSDDLPFSDEPMTPEPSNRTDMAPPFDDAPNEPPKKVPRQSPVPGMPKESAEPPEGVLPDLPSQIQPVTPDSDDAPPSMPDDDPFKDEPPPPDKRPDADSRPNGPDHPIRLTHGASDETELHWHGTARAKVGVAERAPLKLAPEGEEPGLLPPVANSTVDNCCTVDRSSTADIRHLPSSVTPRRQNPLRAATTRPRDSHVVPTASWTAEPAQSGTPETARRNPLRTY